MPYIFATYPPFTWKRTVPLINFTSYEPVQPMQEMELLEKEKEKQRQDGLKESKDEKCLLTLALKKFQSKIK